MSCVKSYGFSGTAKRVFGLRRQPGRLALAVFRIPLVLYRQGWGSLLGHSFLLLVHAGRTTGQPHSTVTMILRYDPETGEAVICSVWGQNTDWIRNLRARPALQIQIGRKSFVRAALPLRRREHRLDLACASAVRSAGVPESRCYCRCGSLTTGDPGGWRWESTPSGCCLE